MFRSLSLMTALALVAGLSAGGAASLRSRRRHCFAAASIAASAPRLASCGTRP